MKLFLCACSAWDLILGEVPASKKQRSADVGSLNQTVNAACPDVFPASLMQLLSLWEEGNLSAPSCDAGFTDARRRRASQEASS